MALPLGKLTLLVGAGLVGSVLAKEGRLPGVSDFFSGAFKIVFKQLKQEDSTTSSSKPKNDSLLQQVNSLRQELQLLASTRSVTIVTGDRSGSGKYGIIIVVVVVGYGYIWWKGWRLSDMMFATRRGLNDACSSVAKQLETVYSSVSATRKHLSSRIDRVDCKVDECADNIVATKEEVSELRGDVKLISSDVNSVHHAVRSLETKISRIEGRQNETNFGVGKLVAFVKNLENTKTMEQIEGSASRPALELPQVSPSRAVSLPSNSLLEPSPSTSNRFQTKQAIYVSSDSLQSSAAGLKIHGISEGIGVSSLSTPESTNEIHASEVTNSSESSNFGVLGRRFSGIGASFLTRSRSALQSFK
ncbi:hypothetical protein F511_10755 [Dorcoceras hygrometricum]|uniref:DUF1664 domain-containing protein n=1 Tax=Dorcoceras hygrometricum TaxID=472368 RepID=A0A2Z7CHW6_9LAMI|nr:hypothetical protein F511_10755 [Dorcoceras hygrometricum]